VGTAAKNKPPLIDEIDFVPSLTTEKRTLMSNAVPSLFCECPPKCKAPALKNVTKLDHANRQQNSNKLKQRRRDLKMKGFSTSNARSVHGYSRSSGSNENRVMSTATSSKNGRNPVFFEEDCPLKKPRLFPPVHHSSSDVECVF